MHGDLDYRRTELLAAGLRARADKVPAFAGVHKNAADSTWSNAGFDSSNISYLDGNGNYKIGYQSLAGGIVNPMGGCSGAEITVGE